MAWVALAGLLVLLLLAEAMFRVFPRLSPVERQIELQQETGDREYVRDPELGNRQAPSRDDVHRTLDFAYRIETDTAGFPNRMPWPDTLDIAVLGNSLVIGPGVGIDGQFSTLLGDRLEATVLNFGLAGASPRHHLRIYRRYVHDLSPRVVLVCLWVASDINNTLHFDRWLAEGGTADYFDFRTSFGFNRRSRTPSFKSRARQLLGGRAVLTSILNFAAEARRNRREGFLSRRSFPSGETVFLSVKAQRRLARGMERGELPELRTAFFQPLVELRREAAAAGSGFAVVLIPSKEELYGASAFPEVMRTVMEVRAGLDSLGLPTVDLYEPIRRGAGDASPFFERDIHLNALGNRLAAEALVRWIERRGILSERPEREPGTSSRN